MANIVKDGAGRFSYHYPVIAAIVTSHAIDRDDAMTVGWHSPVSMNPPLYGIAITSSRFTYELIMRSGEFAVNFVGFELAELLASVGGSKGKDVDKFERFGIIKDSPSKTSVPLLKDAYACYECKLVDHKPYGDHEWIVGEIVATRLAEDGFTEAEIIDTSKVSAALYIGSDLYVTTTKDSPKHLSRRNCRKTS